MFTAIIFIIVLGVLVLVHEFGHFIFAKRAGMKVEEFGFGFPPRLFGIKKGETIYSLNWIPFGGFVKIYGEEGEHADSPYSFSAKPVSARLKVVVAGVLMNFLLAALLLVFVNFFGLRIGLIDDTVPAGTEDVQVQIIEIAPNSPAQTGGLQLLDTIKGFKEGNREVWASNIKDVQEYVKLNTGKEVTLLISRGGQIVEKKIQTRENPPPGEGALGISLALTGVVSYPWYDAIWRGIYDAAILTINTAAGYYLLFKTLIFDGHLAGEVSGPIGIANLTGQAARVGFNYLMQFVAMISVNLAVLNIIPFPALDGGRGVMILVEKIKGSPVNRRVENMINTVGFSLLIALMIYVTIKDISRFL